MKLKSKFSKKQVSRQVLHKDYCLTFFFSNCDTLVRTSTLFHDPSHNKQTSIQDLDITYTTNLSNYLPCTLSMNKVNKILGFILRTTNKFQDPEVKVAILEYCSSVWLPYQETFIDAFEAIQRTSSIVLGGKNLDAPYSLIMETTEPDRQPLLTRGGLVFMNKLLHNLLDCSYIP